MPRRQRLAARTARLHLDPIAESDADELFDVLNDPELHHFTGGAPLGREALKERITRWQRRQSPDGTELWLNWTVRLAATGGVIGYVQSTVRGSRASIAYVIGTAHGGKGLATEATVAMCEMLHKQFSVTELIAHVRPEHLASQHVARHVGLTRTSRLDEDGEEIWKLRLPIADVHGQPGEGFRPPPRPSSRAGRPSSR